MFLPEGISVPLIVVVGPTGVGKTAFAVDLAERIGGEIISADSRQVYRQMDIGTARPSAEELARVPHHLIGVIEPDERWSIADFISACQRIIKEVYNRGKTPLIVGGTGQYVNGFVYSWVIPDAANEVMRAVLERMAGRVGKEGLHRKLALLDPVAAEGIDASNVRRTIRALEVILTTGRRFSEVRTVSERQFSTITFGLEMTRETLYAQIDRRIDQMIVDGLVYEVEKLRAQGYERNLPSMSAIGYQEIYQFLDGELLLDEAVSLIKRHTREYIRRQANWYRAEDDAIHWLKTNQKPVDAAVALLGEIGNWRLKVDI